jgi:hypothetical protein
LYYFGPVDDVVAVAVYYYYCLESFAEHFHVFALDDYDDCDENVDQA